MISLWVALVAIVLFLCALYFLRTKDTDGGDPLPGPPAIPFFGNIFEMIPVFQNNTYPFSYFSAKYGEIYSLKVPLGEIVILASYDAVTDVFNKDEAMDRDALGIMKDRNFGQKNGMVFGTGEMWDKSRKWAVRNLRDFGFAKSNDLENSVNIEIAYVFEQLDKKEKDGKIVFPVSHTFIVPVSRIMYKMIAGYNTPINQQTLVDLNHHTSVMEKASGFTKGAGGAVAIYFPFIRFLFPKFTGRIHQLSCRKVFQKESRRLLAVATAKMSQPKAEPDSLADKFAIQQMKLAANNETSIIFTDTNHDMLFSDLFQGSGHTTSSFLEFLFLFLILNPDVQDKLYSEIQDTVPAGHEVTYEDKARMIYAQAVLLECHRLAQVVQNLVPHKAGVDFKYKNFKINKNAILVADLNSIYHNPETFEDHEAFKPERFIDANGDIANDREIIPFSVGKRRCPGELFADVTAFLFCINFVKTYKLEKLPGEPDPKREVHIGLTSSPAPYTILLTKRTSK